MHTSLQGQKTKKLCNGERHRGCFWVWMALWLLRELNKKINKWRKTRSRFHLGVCYAPKPPRVPLNSNSCQTSKTLHHSNIENGRAGTLSQLKLSPLCSAGSPFFSYLPLMKHSQNNDLFLLSHSETWCNIFMCRHNSSEDRVVIIREEVERRNCQQAFVLLLFSCSSCFNDQMPSGG